MRPDGSRRGAPCRAVAPAVSARMAIASAVAADVTAKLAPIATAVGAAWAGEVVRRLRADDRAVVGAWPGTMSEARMRVLARLHLKLDAEVLDDLARVATVAARREWQQVSEPDLEP